MCSFTDIHRLLFALPTTAFSELCKQKEDDTLSDSLAHIYMLRVTLDVNHLILVLGQAQVPCKSSKCA